jgi:hypothetical protein
MLCAYRGISKYHHYSPSLEPTIYRTRSEHANYYATDVISNIRCFTLQTVDYTYVLGYCVPVDQHVYRWTMI